MEFLDSNFFFFFFLKGESPFILILFDYQRAKEASRITSKLRDIQLFDNSKYIFFFIQILSPPTSLAPRRDSGLDLSNSRREPTYIISLTDQYQLSVVMCKKRLAWPFFFFFFFFFVKFS